MDTLGFFKKSFATKWDYTQGIGSGNCKLVAVYGESGGYRFLRLVETISERVLRRYVG
jgi:hypothetical protein